MGSGKQTFGGNFSSNRTNLARNGNLIRPNIQKDFMITENHIRMSGCKEVAHMKISASFLSSGIEESTEGNKMPKTSTPYPKYKKLQVIMDTPKELKIEFTRKGRHYSQIGFNGHKYIYRVAGKEGYAYYEVFDRKITNGYKASGLQVKYPGDESFGLWAKCTSDLDRAMRYFNSKNLNQ